MIITNKQPKNYPFIIFDLDGTLVDTCPDIVNTVQYIIDKYHFEKKSAEFIRSCIGGGARNVLLRCLGEDKAELIDSELISLFAEYYTEHCAIDSKVYPGVKETLDYYKSEGKALSVATFKIRSATERIFNDFGLMHYFDVLVTADDVENPKPAPDCINAILSHYRCKPEEAVLIGDTKTDYLTGTNAGIEVCGVTYGYNEPDVVKGLKPAYVIDEIEEMKKVVL